MFGIFVFVLVVGVSNRTVYEVTAVPTDTPMPTPSPTPEPLVGYLSQDVTQGRSAFMGTCAGCHGQGGTGIPGVGHSLVGTDFMNAMDDEALREFIIAGRPATDPQNTTGIAMPARGGNPSLTDATIDHIIAYLRTEADPSQLIIVEATEPRATNTPRPPGEVVLNPTVVPYVELPPLEPRPFDVARAYALSCSGCHGPQGQGIARVTAPIWESELLDAERHDDLFEFIMVGNPYAGYLQDVPHPARGDYPSLTDEQIVELIDYLLGLDG